MPRENSPSPFSRRSFSRRSFLHLSAAASTVAALPVFTEPMLAAAAHGPAHKPIPKDAVIISQNENPLGPSQKAREAMAAIIPQGGRYSLIMTDDLIQTFANQEGLKPEYVAAFPGSSDPLHYSVLAFTSPQKSFVIADPGYEAGMHAAGVSGARVVKVPVTKNYAHDVKAMVAAALDAGLFYVCTPNNPTGTLTPHSDIEYLVENKPAGSVVMVDEAYIHLSSGTSTLDLVKAGKDVIVLRTFSKIYGMAGLRCGFAIARPDLLEKISRFNGWGAMPITAVAAAQASLQDPQLVPERKRIIGGVRQETFEWLDRGGYKYIPSEANFFMLDTKRPGKQVIDAMAEHNVYVGRVWPVWPTYVRVTVGTHDEMAQFQSAWQKVMNGTAAMSLPSAGIKRVRFSSRRDLS
jgi:histidinol-phosphate aminotransferase